MVEDDARMLASVRNEFAAESAAGDGGVAGSGIIRELVPETGRIAEYAEGLNLFARKNPIYYKSYRRRIAGVDCTVHEGDINEYWLASIGHGSSSRAPFSPTWMCSALLVALRCAESGFAELVDVGSGDGRVAYCARLAGLDAYSIEIDGDLVGVQCEVARGTGIRFETRCADVMQYDFGGAGLARPVFCIGGLAQMGGEDMASGIIKSMGAGGWDAARRPGFVLAGTRSKKYAHSEDDAGWGRLIRSAGMTKTGEICLPTAWTSAGRGDDGGETPYVFAEMGGP